MTSTARPAVSIVIPCYNAQATIAETIDSALAQDVDCQVIVVDDGSTDGSAAVLQSYGDRIETLSGPNRGVSAARNSGIDAARGDWIQFLDSDDLLAPGTLALRLAAAQPAGADMVICDWRDFTQSGSDRAFGEVRSVDRAALEQDPEVAMATHVWAPPAAVLYRRALAEKVGGFRQDLPVIQDARFLFDAVCAPATLAFSPHVGAFYRIADASLSRRDPSRFWRDVLLNGQQIEASWRARDALNPARRQALQAIFDDTARALFVQGDPRFLEAVGANKALGPAGLSRRVRAAVALSRWIGVEAARRLLSRVCL
jgi:glycosyltransferase involved in cell wall biosynthesis